MADILDPQVTCDHFHRYYTRACEDINQDGMLADTNGVAYFIAEIAVDWAKTCSISSGVSDHQHLQVLINYIIQHYNHGVLYGADDT